MHRATLETAVGLALAREIRDEHGRLLLAAGARLTPEACARLARRQQDAVYVRDGIADELAPGEGLAARTRQLVAHAARDALHWAERGGTVPLGTMQRAVDAAIADLTSGGVLELDALRSASQYLFTHSVHVCAYALLMGVAMGLPAEHLRALGMGALLHDVGKVCCAGVWNKPGPLTPEEWTVVRRHAKDGFELLRPQRGLHLFAAHAAFQHHERLDGSGYPRGLSGEQILPIARMVAVADVFDAMTAERPHAGAVSPQEAVAELLAGAGRLYDAEAVRIFTARVAIFPTAARVRLRDGTVAVVVAQGRTPQQPVVRLLGRSGQVFSTPQEAPATGDLEVAAVLGAWPEWLGGGAPAPA